MEVLGFRGKALVGGSRGLSKRSHKVPQLAVFRQFLRLTRGLLKPTVPSH